MGGNEWQTLIYKEKIPKLGKDQHILVKSHKFKDWKEIQRWKELGAVQYHRRGALNFKEFDRKYKPRAELGN